jgi:hypothetical protein
MKRPRKRSRMRLPERWWKRPERLLPLTKMTNSRAASDIEDLSKLAKDFGGLLPIKQLTLKASGARGELEMDVVGAGRRLESTECAKEFLTSIVRGYGYSVVRQELTTGTIRLWLTPRRTQ